jgi:membrane protein implicated in regulation of membrane protease activity
MAWWLWLVLGLLLLSGEVVTPGGFYVLFFGLAALLVGGLVWLGAAGPEWVQWLLFSALSVVSLLALRGPLLRRIVPQQREAVAVDTLVGELAVALEDLAPGAIGKAELRGTAWTARNAGTRPLARGERARVEHVDGLTLTLRERSSP